MTNYPQQPARGAQGPDSRGAMSAQGGDRGLGDNPLADPGVRMILSMSPQDGSIKPLPENLNFEETSTGSIRVSFPDGSIRELIPGAQGEGRMITTLSDGTRIQSDLTMGEGQVSVASISNTGEKTFLSLNQNGANMQRISADGDVSDFIPESAPQLVESFREAEAFAQAEDAQYQQQFDGNQQYGEWNNFGKPADWQPPQNFDGGFNQPGNWQPPQNFDGNNFARPDYAGSNWVDNGNGSWIAPVQPDFSTQSGNWNQPGNWQPPQNFDGGFNQPGNWQPPQEFGSWNNYGKPADWQPEPNWQPPQNFDGNNFARPDYAGSNWVDNGNGSWIAPVQPDFSAQQGNWMPPQNFDGGFNQPGNWMPPQNFDGGFNQPGNWQPPQNFDGGFNQPGNWMPPQNFDGGFNQPGNWQPPQNFDGGFNQPGNWMPPQQGGWDPAVAAGFTPAPATDSSGFPFAPQGDNAQATSAMLNDMSGQGYVDASSVIENLDAGDQQNDLNQSGPQF